MEEVKVIVEIVVEVKIDLAAESSCIIISVRK